MFAGLVPVQPPCSKGAKHNQREENETCSVHGMDEPGQAVAQEIAERADSDDPTDGSQQVEDEEATPVHLESSGEDSVEHTKSRNETREEDGERTMLADEIFASLNGLGPEVEDATVTLEQGTPTCTTDPVADVVSGGRCEDGDQDDPYQTKVGMGSGEGAGDKKDRLPGERCPGTLQEQTYEDDPVAIVGE